MQLETLPAEHRGSQLSARSERNSAIIAEFKGDSTDRQHRHPIKCSARNLDQFSYADSQQTNYFHLYRSSIFYLDPVQGYFIEVDEKHSVTVLIHAKRCPLGSSRYNFLVRYILWIA